MLYEAYEKIASEVGSMQDKSISIDRGTLSTRSRVNIGSILELDLSLHFFADNKKESDKKDEAE